MRDDAPDAGARRAPPEVSVSALNFCTPLDKSAREMKIYTALPFALLFVLTVLPREATSSCTSARGRDLGLGFLGSNAIFHL